MSNKFQLLFIAQLGEPETTDMSLFDTAADGPDEHNWMLTRLDEIGVRERVELTTVYVCRGEAIPDPGGFDAVIVGGSDHSVNEHRDWQQRIQDWFPGYRDTGRPLLGICGGHQLISQWQGVDVDKLPGGPFASTSPIEFTEAGRRHPLFHDLTEEIGFHFGNSDYVTAPPPGATVLARKDNAPAVALDHGGNWYSIQFHPELSREVMAIYWQHEAPERVKDYSDTPEAPKLLLNFLKLAGLDRMEAAE